MKTPAIFLTVAAVAVSLWPASFAYAEATDYDGPARWEADVVTVGPDLLPAAREWGDVLTFKTVPAGEADIAIARESFGDEGVGGEAQATFHDGDYLESCSIVLPEGEEVGLPILTHEFGHCLGLTHRAGVESSNMHWWAKDYQGGWSDDVTDSDRAALAELYR